MSNGLSEVGLWAPPDLVEFYGWHDGTATPQGVRLDDLHLLPGFYFVGLEAALVNLQTFRSSERWRRDWLPVFANGGGDFLAVDCSTDPACRGSIVHFRFEEIEQPVEYESVAALIATLVDAYRLGAFYLDDSGYLELDDERFVAIAAALNPSVAWWR